MPFNPALLSAGHAEIVLKIGPDTKVFTEIERDSAPVVCIQAGEWQLLFYPLSDAEGMQPRQAEADRASEIVIAFAQWRNAIMEKAAGNQGSPVGDQAQAVDARGDDNGGGESEIVEEGGPQ